MLKEIEKKYSIENFIFHKLPDENIVVQSKNGIVKITDQTMINFVQTIDNQELYQYLNYSFIEEVFKDKTNEAIEFLTSYGIISDHDVNYNFNVKGYEFFSNDQGFLKMVEYITKDDYQNKNLDVNYHDRFDLINFSEHRFVCCFLNPYNKTLAQKIVDHAKKSNCTLLMAYTYNNNIYINNLYKEAWKNPCHFCNLGHIESQLRIQTDGNVTYQQLVDSIYHEDPQFQIELKLKNRETLNIVNQILNIMDKFIVRNEVNQPSTGYSSYNLNESLFIDLLTHQVIKDFSIHWELCDCYE